jgi:hypothetical protein
VSDPSRLPSSDDGLEELGDEVIIAQETEAHSPQPRVQVATDQPSIMISEPQPGPRKRVRTRNEQTVVIRDRKQLEQMRRAVHKQKAKPPLIETRTLYLLGAAALASLALGTLIAFIVDSRSAALPASVPHTAETVQVPGKGTRAPIEEVTPSSPKPRRSDAP